MAFMETRVLTNAQYNSYGRSRLNGNPELVIELSAAGGTPPPPYELLASGAINDATYNRRVNEMMVLLKKWSWSRMLRVYLIIGIGLSIIAPWPLMFLINKLIIGNNGIGNDQTDVDGRLIITEQQAQAYYNARLASFGTLVGLFLVIWVPYFVWSFVGQRKIRLLLQSWTTSDSSPPRPAHTHLTWLMTSNSTFRLRSNLIVRLPPSPFFKSSTGVASNFHPQAYLPAYVAQPGPWSGPAPAPGQAQVQGFQGQGQFMPPVGPPPAEQYGTDEKA